MLSNSSHRRRNVDGLFRRHLVTATMEDENEDTERPPASDSRIAVGRHILAAGGQSDWRR